MIYSMSTLLYILRLYSRPYENLAPLHGPLTYYVTLSLHMLVSEYYLRIRHKVSKFS